MNTLLELTKNIFIFYPIVFSVNFIIFKFTTLRSRTSKTMDIIIGAVHSITISLLCLYLNYNNSKAIIYSILCISILILMIVRIEGNRLTIIILTILSVCITYIIKVFCELLAGSICYFLNVKIDSLTSGIILDILFFIVLVLLTKIKRIKKCFAYFEDINHFGFGVFISGLVIVANIIIYSEYFLQNTFVFITIGFAISLAGLVLWIRKVIKEHYIRTLQEKSKAKYNHDISQKDNEIEKLLNENSSLSSIIHLDNYLISEMESTLKSFGDDAVRNLLTLSKQRNDFLNNKIINDKILPSTGSSEIDAVITDMYIKAASRGIDFTLNIDCDINYLIHNIIERTDFEELVKDCVTNSIVAIEKSRDSNGKILIRISQPNDIYEFIIMDNGISDDDNTKAISEIIEKSKASIKTNIFAGNDLFTKSIVIRFDRLRNKTIKNITV